MIIKDSRMRMPRFAYAKQIIVFFLLTVILTGTTFNTTAQTNDAQITLDVDALKADLAKFHRSPELVDQIDNIINTLGSETPTATRIELDLWKLKGLADVSDTQMAADFAYEMYQKYSREEFKSEIQFGDTMQQIVQAVTKTDNLELSFRIVENLRESLYQDPSAYLSFIIDKILMEIYIETFDYQRALDVELSILNNPEYMALDVVNEWRYSLLNEIAFLYNRLGNGEKALQYLALAKEAFEQQTLHPADLAKVRALNFGNRGRAYLLIGDYVQAEKMGLAVLDAGDQLEQFYLKALGQRLVGSAAFHLGKDEKARRALTSGIALAETLWRI